MLFERLLALLFLRWLFNDSDNVQQETEWPTWVVVVLGLLVIGGFAGVIVYFAMR